RAEKSLAGGREQREHGESAVRQELRAHLRSCQLPAEDEVAVQGLALFRELNLRALRAARGAHRVLRAFQLFESAEQLGLDLQCHARIEPGPEPRPGDA